MYINSFKCAKVNPCRFLYLPTIKQAVYNFDSTHIMFVEYQIRI